MFKSEKQKRYLERNKPAVANKIKARTGNRKRFNKRKKRGRARRG